MPSLFTSIKFFTPANAIYFGFVTLLLSIVVLAGWSIGMPAFTTFHVGEEPMSLISAICFGLTGGALILRRLLFRPYLQWLQFFIASLILLMSVAAALQLLHYLSWPDFNRISKSAGQISPVSVFGFALTGCLLICAPRAKHGWSGQVIKIGTAMIGAIGFIGVLSYIVNMDYLYIFQNSKQMAFPTALGFIVVAIGIWCMWRDASWNVEKLDEIAARHIYRTSDILLIVIVSIVALASFGLSQGRTEKLMLDQMTVVAKDRRVFFETVLESHINQVVQISSRPAIISFMRTLMQSKNRLDATQLAPLDASAKTFLSHGYSAFAYLGPSSEVITSHGQFIAQAEQRIALGGKYASDLLWQDGYVLHTRVPLTDAAGTVGYILAEQPLTELTRLHREALSHGQTGDMVVCALVGDRQNCFPLRWNTHAATYPAYLDGKALPLTRAAKGETATDITHDFRRQRVMAALGPIGSTGLGMAIKMDMWELYEPIRRQFFYALPFLLLLIAGSIWLMRVRLHPLVEAIEKSQRELSFMALHDSLTGLPNRLMFNDRLNQAMIRAKRSKNVIAVMYLDLDHFKKINDTYGHQVGDDVLRWFAAHLQNAVRASDTVARLGGDEFTIILENLSSRADAERIAQTIQKLVGDANQALPGIHIKGIGTSIGIAFYQGDETEPEKLLRNADAALYQCKQQGRGGYQIASNV